MYTGPFVLMQGGQVFDRCIVRMNVEWRCPRGREERVCAELFSEQYYFAVREAFAALTAKSLPTFQA